MDVSKPDLNSTRLEDLAIVVDPERDDVAVARDTIAAGITIKSTAFGQIGIRSAIMAGHRFALRAVPAGVWVKQYGQPFARSKGIVTGDSIDSTTVVNEVPHVDAESVEIVTPELPAWEGDRPSFMGFRRADGRVGVRNWVLIVPTSMCSSHEASTIALRAEAAGIWSREKYPNVDGVTAIPHTRGCGCPDYEPTAAGDERKLVGVVEGSMRMLGRYIEHPNVGAVLVIELGCEKTNVNAVGKYVALGEGSGLGVQGSGKKLEVRSEKREGPLSVVGGPLSVGLGEASSLTDNGPLTTDHGQLTTDNGQRTTDNEQLATLFGKPVMTMSVQSAGGTAGTIKRGLELLPQLLAEANRAVRVKCDVRELCIGLKCGGSDAFSGLSANPALGAASDLLIRAGGRSIITEIPEFFGAEHLFAARARDRRVAREIYAAMERFRAYVARVGGSMAENPSPGNREGGLMNITIKSLGALAKSGRAAVEGVLDYGQSVWERGRTVERGGGTGAVKGGDGSGEGERGGLWLLYCTR